MSAPELLEAVDRIIARGGDPEDVLQAIVTAIVDRTDAKWAAVLVNEDSELLVGHTPASPSPASADSRRSSSKAHTAASSRSTGSTISR